MDFPTIPCWDTYGYLIWMTNALSNISMSSVRHVSNVLWLRKYEKVQKIYFANWSFLRDEYVKWLVVIRNTFCVFVKFLRFFWSISKNELSLISPNNSWQNIEKNFTYLVLRFFFLYIHICLAGNVCICMKWREAFLNFCLFTLQ